MDEEIEKLGKRPVILILAKSSHVIVQGNACVLWMSHDVNILAWWLSFLHLGNHWICAAVHKNIIKNCTMFQSTIEDAYPVCSLRIAFLELDKTCNICITRSKKWYIDSNWGPHLPMAFENAWWRNSVKCVDRMITRAFDKRKQIIQSSSEGLWLTSRPQTFDNLQCPCCT